MKLVSSKLSGSTACLAQDRHQAEDQRQFAIVGAGEIEAHRARVESLRLWRL